MENKNSMPAETAQAEAAVSFEVVNQIIEIVETKHTISFKSEELSITDVTRILFAKRPAKTVTIPYGDIRAYSHYRVWNWYFLACALAFALLLPPVWLKLLLTVSMLLLAAKYDVVITKKDGSTEKIRYSKLFRESGITEQLEKHLKA